MDDYYDNNNFDIDAFNKEFTKRKKEIEDREKKKEMELTDKMNKDKSEGSFISPIVNVISDAADSVFGLLHDIVSLNYRSFDDFKNIFVKENRLFYLGICLLITSLLMYIISYLFFPKEGSNDININIPKDYSFKYYPFEQQKAEDVKKIIDLEKEVSDMGKQNEQLQNRLETQGRFFRDQSRQMNTLAKQVNRNHEIMNLAAPESISSYPLVQTSARTNQLNSQTNIQNPQLSMNNFGQPLARPSTPPQMGGESPIGPEQFEAPPHIGESSFFNNHVMEDNILMGGDENRTFLNELNKYVTFEEDS